MVEAFNHATKIFEPENVCKFISNYYLYTSLLDKLTCPKFQKNAHPNICFQQIVRYAYGKGESV